MVIRFDLSSITDIDKIDSVKLAFYSVDVKAENSCSLYVITNDWDANVTWNNRKSGSSWSTAGGDIDRSSLIAKQVPDYGLSWEEFDVTDHVMAMLNGTKSNYGFLLKVEYCTTTDFVNYRHYASSEYATQELRPKLVFYADEFPDIDPPEVDITSPNGGALSPNTNHTITWTATDDVGVVSRAIYFSSNNGTSFTKVDSTQSNTGSFDWTVPVLQNSACKILIHAYDLANNRGSDTSRTFSIGDDQSPTVTVTAPPTGAEIEKGTTYTIIWDASDNVEVTSREISYICDGQPWTVINTADGNTGAYEWSVPYVNKPNCRIQVKVFDGAGNSNFHITGVFSIGDFTDPQVTITKPATGETVAQGSAYAITWTATDNNGIESRALHFSSDNGATWSGIDTATGNTGTFNWTAPMLISANCLIMMNVYDTARNLGTAVTQPFSIVDQSAPTVSVTAPATGAILKQGATTNITWTAENRLSIVNRAIYFSANGTDFEKIDSALGNTGNFTWTIPVVSSANCAIKVFAYDESANQGVGVSGTFSIVDGTAPTVTVVTPTAGSDLPQGSVCDITWTAEDKPGIASRAIYFSANGTDFEKVDSALGNTGTYAWTVPTIISAACKIKINVYDEAGNPGTNESGVFNIVDVVAPTVAIVTPAGGEVLQQNASFAVTWTATDNMAVAMRLIYFSADSGTSWSLVDSATSNTGSFAWSVPVIVTTKGLIKVCAYDASGNCGTSISQPFSIALPTGIIPNAFNQGGVEYQVTITNIQGRVVASFATTDLSNLSSVTKRLSSGIHIMNVMAQGKKLVLRRCFVK